MQLPGMPERLGWFTAGDDYRRLIPLMDAIPAWLHFLAIIAGVMYLTGAIFAGLRNRWGTFAVLVGMGLELMTTRLVKPIIEAAGVAAYPNPSVITRLFIPIILPLMHAWIIWQGNQKRINKL